MTKKLFTPQLTLNWLTRILFFISLSAFLPAMPRYISDIGGNYSQTGIVMSAFAVGVLIFRPLVGRKVDNLGRKIVLIFGILIFVISPVIYMFIKSVNLLIPIRIFHGLGLAAFGTASITLITDAAPLESQGEVLSYTGMVNTIAFASGPILGFWVLDNWGFNILFSFLSGLAILCLIFSLFLNETKTHLPAGSSVKYFKTIWKRKIIVAATVIMLIGLVHGGVMFYIPFYLEDFKVNIGLFFSVYGISAFLIRFVVSKASDQIGRGPIVVFSLILLTVGVFMLSQATGVISMFIAAILYGFGFGAQQPVLTALVADNTTEETRGKVFSFYYGGFDLGISIAGFLLGFIAEKFGIRNMFIVCSFITFLALLIFSTIIESSPLQSLQSTFSVRKAANDPKSIEVPT